MANTRRSNRLVAQASAPSAAAAATPPAAATPAAAAATPAANESSNGEGVKKRIKTSASVAIKPKNFFRPNKSNGDQPKLSYDKRPNNIAAKEKQKKAGKLWGYGYLKPGRPSKTVETDKEVEDVSESNPEDIISRVKQQPPSRGGYQKYEGKTEEAMQAAVHAYILAGSDSPFAAAKAAAHEIIPNYVPNRSTVMSRVEKEKKCREEAASKDEHYFDRKQPGGRGLTNNDDREMIQSIAANCDNKNDGLTRKGMIQLVTKFTGSTYEKAKEHYKYLVRSGKLSKLKRGGRTIKAQATTTNRTAVTTEKLFRTYLAQEEAFEEQKRLNGPEFTGELCDFFCVNLDETCFLASEGMLSVIGNAEKSKQEKNTSDSRLSVTAVRCGSSAGEDLSRVFLAKGKEAPAPNLRPGNFEHQHKAPKGSGVIMTPNAFMTDDAWVKTVEILAPGIRAAPIICEHPDWWVILSLDGYGSHLCTKALQIFRDHKIIVVKEEGDTSQVCQAYDQLVAKADKRLLRENLDTVRFHVNAVITQWELILIANQAMNSVPRKDWQDSFERVNFRPSKRIPFVQWVKKHEEQTRSADSLFSTDGSALFDAMPSLWKNMSEERRAEVCSLFAKIETSRGDPWSKENLTELVNAGVHIEDIVRLRGCYLVTKQDSTVLKDPPPPPATDFCGTATGRQSILSKDFNGFAFAPERVLKPYLEDKEKHGKLDESKLSTLDKLDQSNLKTREVKDGLLSTKTELELVNTMPLSKVVTCWPNDRCQETAAALFRHMCNFTAATHGYANDGDLTPSNYLDVHVSGEQRKLLNPSYRDVLIGEILDQSSGVKATKKLAKRRIEFVNGNVNSYARVLNGQAQMDAIKTYNDLAASLATYNAEKHQRDEERKEEKKKKNEEKEAKKRLQKEKEAEEHARILPGCREDVEDRGKVWVLGLSVKRKKEILKHYFSHDKSLYKLNLADTNVLIEQYFAALPGADSNEGAVSNSTTAAEVDAGEASVDEDQAVQRALQLMMESVTNAEAGEEEADEAEVEADEVEVEARRTGRKRKRTEKANALAAEKM